MHSNVPFSRMQFRVDIADVRFEECLYVCVGPCVLLEVHFVTAHLDEKLISSISRSNK